MCRGSPFTLYQHTFCFLVILLTVPTVALSESIGREFLPPEHWTYPALERFEALGLVRLPAEKPYSRDDVVAYVETITASVDRRGFALSSRDRFELERLEAEFSSAEARTNPRRRYDRPLIYAVDPPLRIEFDADAVLAPREDLRSTRWDFFLVSDPEFRLHAKDWLTVDVRYRLIYGPERDDRARDEKPSPREKSFKGLTSLYERATLVARFGKVTLFAGRDYADFGPSERGNLILSPTAESLDKIGGRIPFKMLRFSSLHATLSRSAERYLAAHRLEVGAGPLTLGVSESVVYVGRAFDPIYLLPFGSFYANQFNEGDDDNVLWSLDAKYRFLGHITLFGNLLIDDFQFERDKGTPDKLAFELGARAAFGGPIPSSLLLSYRYVDIYTYTHEDSGKAYVAMGGDPAAGDPLLGAVEGPDTDHLLASAAVYPWPSVTLALSFSNFRRGEGNDFRTFFLGMDPNPPFPSGVVERTTSLGCRLLWELPGNSAVGGDVAYARVVNADHQLGDDGWHTAVRLFGRWDF